MSVSMSHLKWMKRLSTIVFQRVQVEIKPNLVIYAEADAATYRMDAFSNRTQSKGSC